MDEDLNPKIVDFGLSKIENSQSMVQSSAGFKGTVLYVAPETFLDGQYLPAGDVYAFSIITYEIYTNERPFNNCDYRKLSSIYSKEIGLNLKHRYRSVSKS